MRIGIMQGRLSPARERAQSFPWSSWEAEFDRARSHGFDSIEWLFDAPGYEDNPIWTREGCAAIRRAAAASGVSVVSVCADYFVSHPLLRAAEADRVRHLRVLDRLVGQAAEVGAGVIVLPVLEEGEVTSAADVDRLVGWLREPARTASAARVELALESNMPAELYLHLSAAEPRIGICFDTGNRSAAGRDIVGDLGRLAPYLREVHVKDRGPDGRNVPLGTGATPLDAFLTGLGASGYAGPLVLETTVGDDYAAQAGRNLAFVRARSAGREGRPVASER